MKGKEKRELAKENGRSEMQDVTRRGVTDSLRFKQQRI